MRSLLLAAALLAPVARAQTGAPAPAAAAASASADWRRADLSAAQKDALAASGYRLEADGRVLDPTTLGALSSDEFSSALTRLGLGAQQSALERLRLLLAKDDPTPADRAAIAALRGSLPDDVAKAVDAGAAAADLRALADRDLSRIAAYFDAARSPQQRVLDAAPVALGAPGPRTPLPYFDPAERALGDSLRAAAVRTLGRDPVGREVLARLNGPDGKPVLPPIVVENSPDGAAADYNYARRALVVDVETLRASIVGGAPAPQRAALRAKLSSRSDLISYADSHPDSLAAFAAQNDALLAHELTHAWQDRRDPVMQEMARGALPPALIIDDEVEAWTVKNLYVASRLKNDPRASLDPNELADFASMAAGRAAWQFELQQRYQAAAPDAMNLGTVADMQALRVARTRARTASTADEQASKSLDLLMQTRAQREVQSARTAQEARLTALGRDADAASAQAPRLLAEHFLAAADDAANPTERAANLQQAERFARASGDAGLLARVQARQRKTP
jgi:hypothetical protein